MIACPTCGGPTTVTETRDAPSYVRRRRACLSVACGAKVTTAECVLGDPRRSNGGQLVLVPERLLQDLRVLTDRLALAGQATLFTNERQEGTHDK